VRIEVVRPTELGALADAWRALQRRELLTDTPFLSPSWAVAVDEVRGGRGVRVAVLSEGERPVAFMPAQIGRITAMAAGGAMSDYEGVVGEPLAELDLVELLRVLGVSRYDFTVAPAGQPFSAFAQGRATSWIVDVADGYRPYAETRRADGVSALKELDRKRRKVEREVGPLEFSADSRDRAAFERLIALKRAQYRAKGQTDVFAAGWPLALVRRLFEAQPAGCAATLFTLRLAGQLAAVQLHLVSARTIHAWIIAHEPRFERYAPGLLLFQQVLMWMDGQVHDRVDLGHGDYRFKRELANSTAELLHGYVGAPSAARFVRGAVWRLRRAAEALPLGRFSGLPGKAMRRLDQHRGLR
jgi:CelD/BcsL family acetyltransferase involved in cellulose biosynthesis